VVEADAALPCAAVVTATAIVTELALMYVVLPVTAVAVGGDFGRFGAVEVASTAGQLRVPAEQGETGFGVMVETG
jgi:hypothetical protein